MASKLKRSIGVLLMVVVGFTGAARADYLLSDNDLDATGDYTVVPSSTLKVDTGATYSWLYGNLGNVRGNTDSSIISTDDGDDMVDNVSSAGGGNYDVWQTFSGGSGTGTGNGPFAAHVATAEFDLKNTYKITKTVLNCRFDGNNGVGRFEAWISTDGVSFTQWGVWTDNEPSGTDWAANLEITATAADARYVQLYASRLGDGVADHSSYYQMALGEMVIYGIPEPATLVILIAGASGLFCRRRQRRKS